MAEGVVRWFSDKIGIGFIETDDGDDIFVDHSRVNASGFTTLKEGDRILFDIIQEEIGLAAANLAAKKNAL